MVVRLPASRLAANVAKAAWTRATAAPVRGLASPASDKMAMKGKPWSNPYPEDQFSVHPQNGFLPKDEPLEKLPEEYKEMESLLNRMSVKTKDGSPGLLATGDFGAAVDAELPEYDLSGVTDHRVLSALYRDLTFVASAYLLEPCNQQYKIDGTYGLGRQTLPRNIAVPLNEVAAKIGQRPFMEYALSYALYNYKRIDKSKPLEYDNSELIRAFSGCPGEHGFILVHVAMVKHSGLLTAASMAALDAAALGDRPAFDKAMQDMLSAYSTINQTMETMWGRSKPEAYMSYRTWIYGTKNQPMFPNGVIYEGVSDEPFKMRGESGANDSMVPLGDNLLEITAQMPTNPLTEVLRDFRTYRPRNHQSFINYVQNRATAVGVREFALKNANSAAWYLANVDQIRQFRNRHWNFTKQYILKFTKHPVATGGSPIVTWLPNQLDAVLQVMVETDKMIDRNELDPSLQQMVDEIGQRADAQQRVLRREVAALSAERGAQSVDVDGVEKGSPKANESYAA